MSEMREKRSASDTIGFAILAAVMLSAAFVAGYLTHALRGGDAASYPLLIEVRSILDANYLGDLPPDSTLQYGAVRGMVSAVGDPYTIFLEPASQELETQSLQGAFGGIGVNLRQDESGAVVLSPYPDLPAARAGVQEGDVLVAVDGTLIVPEITLDEISALVRGPEGTEVTITIKRGIGPPLEFTMTRQIIEIPSVTGRVLDEDPALGLVAISRFSEKTPAEVQRAIDDLQAKGVKSIVLDLRGNGGGLLNSAVDTAGVFLDGGAILIEAKRGKPENTFTASGKGAETELPLVVLVNHGTASAAEILAGALRDRGRGPLIGQTTFGKGSVQLIFTLSDHSSVHVTNARWYTPGHTGIDAVGLKPDIELQPGTDGSDPELERAIQYLQSQ